MRNLSLSYIMELSPSEDQFIENMECDSQFDPMLKRREHKNVKKCDDKQVIQTLQRNGICFTYFHKMAKYSDDSDDGDNQRVMGLNGNE